jgi:hypothetical protein
MKSYSLNNLTQNDQIINENEQILSKFNIDQDQKLSLIERKKLKWANDTSKITSFNLIIINKSNCLDDAQNAYNPFGKPGAGGIHLLKLIYRIFV